MKTAFYIEDGREQIVLTPESEWEKQIMKMIHDGGRTMSIKRGSFYECRGGFIRNATTPQSDESTIIILDKPTSEALAKASS